MSFDLLKRVGTSVLGMSAPQLKIAQTVFDVGSGFLKAEGAVSSINKQLNLIGDAIESTEAQKKAVTEITESQKGIAYTERKEDRGFVSEEIADKKELVTKSLQSTLNKQGFSTSLRPSEAFESGMESLNLRGDKLITGLERRLGAKLVKIDEEEASRMASIEQSLQNLRAKKAELEMQKSPAAYFSTLIS